MNEKKNLFEMYLFTKLDRPQTEHEEERAPSKLICKMLQINFFFPFPTRIIVIHGNDGTFGSGKRSDENETQPKYSLKINDSIK